MALRYRAMAAFAKGATMGLFGLWVTGVTAWHACTVPQAFTMRAVGTAALLANAISFALLWAFRQGDSNMRSAWIWRRNDVLGNLAVMLAALGVFGHRLARYRGCVHHDKPRPRCLGRSRPIMDRDAGVGVAPTG